MLGTQSIGDLNSFALLTGRLREERKREGSCKMFWLKVSRNGLITTIPTYLASIHSHGHTLLKRKQKNIS